MHQVYDELSYKHQQRKCILNLSTYHYSFQGCVIQLPAAFKDGLACEWESGALTRIYFAK